MNEQLKRCDTCGDETQAWKEVGIVTVCADCYIAFTMSVAISEATAALNQRIAELEIESRTFARGFEAANGALLVATKRVAELEAQLAAKRTQPHLAILQPPVADRMWA